ncbi:MAG: hypothetical protein V3V34_11775 [Kiloniellales bacterium]
MDLRLDPLTHDLVYENGDLQLVGIPGDEQSEKDEIVQRLDVRLRTHLGEWAFDLGEGVNYRGLIFADDADLASIQAHLTVVASGGFRIRSVLAMTVTFDELTRKVSVVGEVDTDLGTLDFDTGVTL